MSGSSSAVEITGVVRDASGTPVTGAHVLFSDGPQPLPDIAAMTNAEGRFSLSAPTAGVYTLACRADPLLGPPGTAETTVRVAPTTEGVLAGRMVVDLTIG
ncbi:carboxypeptidase-like regulatory domain-containing protein [Streptomyces sp. NPDC046853]|uniref:carboxypeptidase-like regulatory domain-containing protein n=1 Tax=unclassified Streptomyces TaxID=2593676 RepID=UPI0033F226DB